MDPASPPHLSVSIPVSAVISIPRAPVARKAVPKRKPIGQAVTSPTITGPSTPNVLRKSVSSSSSIPSSAITPTTTNRSSISSFSTTSTTSPDKLENDLPAGWVSAKDPDGREYYINHQTKATTWTKPELVPSPLLLGWEERTTPDGKVYYCNVQTNATTWDRPTSNLATNTTPVATQVPQPVQAQQVAAPLPLCWEERNTTDGRVYYCNTQSLATQWERPAVVSNSVPVSPLTTSLNQPEQLKSLLPAPWEERTANDGRRYYCNTQTNITTWEKPTLASSQSASILPPTQPVLHRSMTTGHQISDPPTQPVLHRAMTAGQPLTASTAEWEERKTSDGKKYYCNIITGVTSWEIPPITNSTDQPLQPTTPEAPLSPGIAWETSNFPSKSSRRRSHFSLSSISSASGSTLSKLNRKYPGTAASTAVMVKGTKSAAEMSVKGMKKLPGAAASTAVMVQGTKAAAEMSVKGMTSAGKFIKNNKGVIAPVVGMSMKVVSVVLRETSGVDLGGLEGVFDGVGDSGDVGDVGSVDVVETECDADEGDENNQDEEEIVVIPVDPIIPMDPVISVADYPSPPVEPTYYQQPYVPEQQLPNIFQGYPPSAEQDYILQQYAAAPQFQTIPPPIEQQSIPQQYQSPISQDTPPTVQQYEPFPQQGQPLPLFQSVLSPELQQFASTGLNDQIQQLIIAQQQLALDQQAVSGAVFFDGGGLWAQESLVQEQVVQQDAFASQDVTNVLAETIALQQNAVFCENTAIQETVFAENCISEQVTVQNGGVLQDHTIITQDSIVVQETIVQENIMTATSTPGPPGEEAEVTISQVAATAQEVVVQESLNTASNTPPKTVAPPPPTEPIPPQQPVLNNTILPTQQPPIEYPPPPCNPVLPPSCPPADTVSMNPFNFQPILAASLMADPPAENNGVIFNPVVVGEASNPALALI